MPTADPDTERDRQPGITIAQIFLDRASFKHHSDALSLPPNTAPTVGEVNVHVELGVGGDNANFGISRVTVSTNPNNEPAPVYDVVVSMLGFFVRTEETAAAGMPLDAFLRDSSVALMYPFVREAFANLTLRGRFGPVWLNPFNTRALSKDLDLNTAHSKPPE